jgi:hypothetical protein
MSSFETEAPRRRVFVSSVMMGFESYRLAAKSAIVAANADPILVEDYPSLSSSPRNACLDGVRSCDALILIIGDRGGSVAPSGKLVVEEELEEAVKSGLSVFVFIQTAKRDDRADMLVKRVSDYTAGYFRKSFTSAESLAAEVKNTIQSLASIKGGANVNSVSEAFSHMPRLGDQTSLRFVMMSAREEEVIDPVSLDSAAFKGRLMGIAHQADVSLFSYESAKTIAVQVANLLITQEDNRRAASRSVDLVRLELATNGSIIVDANVTNRVPSAESYSMQPFYEIVEEDVVGRLQSCFSFCHFFWEHIDPYLRHQQFAWNAALNNIGHRAIVNDRNVRTSFSVGFGEREPIIAFSRPRKCNRQGLALPREHIDAALAMLRRQFVKRGP